MMAAVSLDRFQARGHDLDHFVLAMAHQVGEGGAYALLVVRDQDPHGRKDGRSSHARRVISRVLLADSFLAMVAT